jgi:hypothetical protein
VTNSGGESGSYTVTLKVDGRVVAAKEPSLAGRESETVTFAVSRDEIGTYSVNVNGLSGFFVVKETTLPTATPPACTALATGASTKPSSLGVVTVVHSSSPGSASAILPLAGKKDAAKAKPIASARVTLELAKIFLLVIS